MADHVHSDRFETLALFESGTVQVSAQAMKALAALGDTAAHYTARHLAGDWGEVDDRQRRDNEFGVRHRHSVISRYQLADGTVLRIASTSARLVTAVQLDAEFVYGVQISVREGYAIWSETYAREKNGLIALEEAMLPALEADLRVETVLDVGTGTGRQALRWARRGARVTALDQSAEMLAVAREAASREGADGYYLRSRRVRLRGRSSGRSRTVLTLAVCSLTLSHMVDLVARRLGSVRGRSGQADHLLLTDLHPGWRAPGWQAEVRRPEVVYRLPPIAMAGPVILARSRAAHGCTVKPGPLKERYGTCRSAIPRRISFGEQRGTLATFCLLILARKTG